MIKKRIKTLLEEALTQLLGSLPIPPYEIEKPKKEIYGDYATNIALVLKNKTNLKPFQIAEKFAQILSEERVLFSKVEVVSPGFINFWIREEYYKEHLREILKKGEKYGSQDLGQEQRVLVEFVSANPTGPLHIGHGRGAAYGDSIARILSFTGYRVFKEYYINDKGTQMEILGRSVYLRAKELSGEKLVFPEGYYRGAYIYEIAKKALENYPFLLDLEEKKAVELCQTLAINLILEDIKKDLENFRVFYDNWYSESTLYERGKVEKVLRLLKAKNLLYEKDGALWFKASLFEDAKDRVVMRSNKEFTYFTGDMAYHYEKFVERGFDLALNLWGADHHGYVSRLKAFLKALDINSERLKVILIQMVNLIEGGKLKSMSTRQGEFVPLKDLMEEVGVDATRFIFLSRSAETPLDFDLDLAKKQSQENPVYYVQYAHARICSLFEKAKASGLKDFHLENLKTELLSEKEEFKLLKILENFPEVVESASLFLAPYKVTQYLLELAEAFHEYYTKHRIILPENLDLTYTRLGLCLACKLVLKVGLDLLGVSAPERM
ncbi:MAG: arginine--tRNA ligase [Thermodesulfobacteriaceae bacterium]|nr:arginine--tRNA ligase [Thermodesulfobacteriaceae bacterium]